MKIEIEIDGLKCKAETDFVSQHPDVEEREPANATILNRLCEEVRAIAFKLIDAKYSSGKAEE